MHTRIREELHKLERDRHIKILYAAEAGSRIWGFESKDSDYDVRFIYVRPMSSYISIASRRDVIEAKELPLMHPLDFSGWDIIKTLDLASKSNPALLEWLRSSIVYHTLGSFASDLRTITHSWNVQQVLHHYSGMAKRSYMSEIVNKSGEKIAYKKYFYALYPILACLYIIKCMEMEKRRPSLPPLRFLTLLEEAQHFPDVKHITPFIKDMMHRKSISLETDDEPRAQLVEDFLRDYTDKMRLFAKTAPDDTKPDMMQLEDLCQRTIRQYQG